MYWRFIAEKGKVMNRTQKKIVLGVLFTAVSIVLIFGGVLLLREKQDKNISKDVSTGAGVVEETPAPTKDPHEGMVRSSMTGQWVTPAVENKRPFAIMINNIEYAFRHQMGTSKADIVYEALAEGGITRMLAVYQDVKNVKQIGSVRSARHYYVQFAEEWDAIFCHFGHTKYAVSKMEKLGTENLSGLSGIGPVVYARTSSLAAPHNVFTSGKKMIKGAKKLGYSLKKQEGASAEHFTFYEKDTALTGGKKAKTITLPFSAYSTCQMKYNSKKKKYLKYEYGNKHMDSYYKKQLSFKNVIVQFVEESNIDRNGYQTMKLTNHSGKGYYFSDGKRVDITWQRNEKNNTMTYRDASGQTLRMNPGKTYIAVYPKSRKNLIRVK